MSTRILVYLDDERPTPDGWVRVYWPDEAIALLEQGNVGMISLDHDLGDDARGTGYDVVKWIEEKVATDFRYAPPVIKVHSANGPARQRMEQGIESIQTLRSRLWPVDEHVIGYERRRLGQAWNGRPLYATSVRCACGWYQKSNENKREAIKIGNWHRREMKEAAK